MDRTLEPAAHGSAPERAQPEERCGACTSDGRWPRIIGILGGLGPHAHIELERCLLEAVGHPALEQAYPAWFVASLPGTPDRTRALLGQGPSPVPALVEGLRRLEPLVDFAVIACHTAHAFLSDVRAQIALPVLSLVDEVIAALGGGVDSPSRPAGAEARPVRVGLLATTGTLQASLYPRAAAIREAPLEFISLLDLSGGRELQQELVMRPIYGGGAAGGGLKSGGVIDLQSKRRHVDALREGAARLVAAGADCIVPACTEISLALRASSIDGVAVFEPLQILAAAALDVASGRRPVPDLSLLSAHPPPRSGVTVAENRVQAF